METSKTLQEYLDELSSNSPTPGGGNVAALCGALASSLGAMVCNLTIGKKKYADVENEMIAAKNKINSYRDEFINLAAKDNEAFNKVMAAFKLPKESESEKEFRSNQIEDATIGAAEIPGNVIKYCREILPLLKTVSEKGNKNSLSDAGVSVILIKSAAQGAYLNVLINCASLDNQTIANEIVKRTDILLSEIEIDADSIYENIIKSIHTS
jgi:formiminotetrahydrofolate cyclodeaminase